MQQIGNRSRFTDAFIRQRLRLFDGYLSFRVFPSAEPLRNGKFHLQRREVLRHCLMKQSCSSATFLVLGVQDFCGERSQFRCSDGDLMLQLLIALEEQLFGLNASTAEIIDHPTDQKKDSKLDNIVLAQHARESLRGKISIKR